MTSIVTFPRGPLEAFVDASGRLLNEAGGHRLTRLQGAHLAGVTAVNVETTLGWPSTGVFYMAGDRYTYAAKTASSFTGLAPPLTKNARTLTPLADGSGTFSGVENARRMLFVSTAEGEFLDAIGRNLGVNRPAGLSDDEYRALIQALAYTPRGTIYAIEILLDAVVGPGNYTIFEDLINFPNCVFISLAASVSDPTDTDGKAFLNARDIVNSSSTTTAVVLEPPVGADKDSVSSVFLAPGEHIAAGDVKPSLEPVTPWTYFGDGAQPEATHVTVNGDGSVKLEDTSALTTGAVYTRGTLTNDFNATLSTEIIAEALVRVNSASGDNRACVFTVADGVRSLVVSLSPTTISFVDGSTGTLIGTSVAIGAGFHEVKIVKRGGPDGPPSGLVDLYVDKVLVSSTLYTLFSTTAARTAAFGSASVLGLQNSDWARVQVSTKDVWTNYWNGRTATHDATTAAGDPDRITAGTNAFSVTLDAGRLVDLRRSTVAHGRGNGRYQIATVGALGAFVDVTGVPYLEGAALDPDRFRIPESHPDPLVAADAGVQATLTTGTGNARIRWLAKYGGADGNAISVQLIAPGVPNSPLFVTVSAGDDIKVNLATNGASAIVSTANDVIAAVLANSTVAAFASADLPLGSDGTAVVAAVATTSLAGGEDGKFLTISGSGLGNNGSYLIATILDDRTMLLGSHLSPPGLVDEEDLDWQKDPNFPTDTGLEWETIAAGTVAGSTLTFRRAIPSSPRALEIVYVTLFSAHILLDEFVANPGTLHPLYLFDPFEFLRAMVDAITVAGVLPKYR